MRIPVPETEEFVQVATLKTGTSFGELSLLTDGKCSATITTRTQTHLATLAKEDYLGMLK